MSGAAGRSGGGAPRVELYTWRWCPYCLQAKALLEGLGIPYREHPIDGDAEARRRMAERAEGRRTVPQVFIDGRPVGGYTELAALARSGRLQALLAAPPPQQGSPQEGSPQEGSPQQGGDPP